jgi:coproporphyrinogen III oxidase-like Fe-S oxidoreductase
VSNIFWNIIFQKPENKQYYTSLDEWNFSVTAGLKLTKRDEMVKYIYLNILFWIHIDEFYNLYKIDIFKVFLGEFKFLRENNIVTIKNGCIIPNKSDLETLLYVNIFFIKNFATFDTSHYNEKDLESFFLESGELIDK